MSLFVNFSILFFKLQGFALSTNPILLYFTRKFKIEIASSWIPKASAAIPVPFLCMRTTQFIFANRNKKRLCRYWKYAVGWNVQNDLLMNPPSVEA
jgi:hypothetical protein